MKREELKKIIEGITDEQLKTILDINGADIEKAKEDYKTVKADLETANKTIADLKDKISNLEASSESAEEYKKQLEELKKGIEEKEKADKAAKEKAERDANILARYNAVAVDTNGAPLEWSHEAVKTAYLQKFTEAIEDKANASKSDADIFKALTINDEGAFKTVKPVVTLKGTAPLGMAYKSKEEISKIKDPIARQQAIKENINLYQNTEE